MFGEVSSCILPIKILLLLLNFECSLNIFGQILYQGCDLQDPISGLTFILKTQKSFSLVKSICFFFAYRSYFDSFL